MSEWIQNNKGLAAVIAIIAVVALGLILFGNGGSSTEGDATVAGIINFNGLKPAEDPVTGSAIKLMQKTADVEDFTDTGVSVDVADQSEWAWDTAVAGTTYELRADAWVGEDFIKSSNVIVSTAPSSDQTLTFNITLEDLPDYVIEERNVTVSGVIDINGFVPDGSTVTIFGRESGTENDFAPAIEGIPATDGAEWAYDEAQPGVTYDYQAEMYAADDTFIGQSQYLTVTAPAANEVVVINSSAEAPVETASISGTVSLRGPVTEGSTLLMLQRQVGEIEYTEFDRQPAVTGQEWSFDDAVQGITYDITAALQVDKENTATGNVIVVAAPATGEQIVIDTGVNIPPPGSAPRLSCGDPDSTGGYNATLFFPYVEDAAAYYYEVGTSAGGNDVDKGPIPAPSDPASDPETNVYVKGDTDYFSRYAYTFCTTCDVYDTTNWSSWSPTLGFKCPSGE